MRKCKINHLVNSLLLAFTAVGIFGCKKYIEEDISQMKVEIEYPTQNTSYDTNLVEISFKPIDGADQYRIEIVQPNFTNIQNRIVDSLITVTRFSIELDSNVYSLVVTASNFGYTSKPSDTIIFSVNSNATSQNLTLIYPLEAYNQNGNEFNKTFSWSAPNSSSNFEFSLKKGTSFQNGVELHQQNITGTSSLELTNINFDHGMYWWRVISTTNGESVSKIGSFEIDTIAPNAPTLNSPVDNAMTSQGVTIFSWTNQESSVESYFEISTSQSFGSIFYNTISSQQSTSVNLNSGVYYWRVRCRDIAGNFSSYSTINKISVN